MTTDPDFCTAYARANSADHPFEPGTRPAARVIDCQVSEKIGEWGDRDHVDEGDLVVHDGGWTVVEDITNALAPGQLDVALSDGCEIRVHASDLVAVCRYVSTTADQ